jgi:hypothetical protein
VLEIGFGPGITGSKTYAACSAPQDARKGPTAQAGNPQSGSAELVP